jgi:hypothetical protein
MADGAFTPKVSPKKKRGNPATLSPAWKPGQSGNPAGKPKGARNKLGEAFLQDMLTAWEAHGTAAIQKVIEERPHEFIKVVAGILPSEVKVQTTAVQELSDDELAAALSALRSAITVADAGSRSNETTLN